MSLTPETERKIDEWISTDTWHTNHDLDMGRWFAFVNQYQKDHGYSMDESALRELVERKLKWRGSEDQEISDYLRKIIGDRISLAYVILDFLKRTGR